MKRWRNWMKKMMNFDNEIVDELVYYDGPLIFTMRDELSDLYYFHECDWNQEEKWTKHLVLKTNSEEIRSLEENKEPLLDFILSHQEIYIYQRHWETNVVEYEKIPVWELPKDYLPVPGTTLYFD